MKVIALAAAAASLLLGAAAHAQQAPAASPLYGELGYSWMTVKGSGFTAHPGAIRGILGYNVSPYVGVEGMLAGGVSNSSDQGVDTKLKSAYGLFVKPKYDFGNTEVFGRVGWAHTNLDLSCGVGACSGGSANDFAYGLGVKYNFTRNMNVGLDYMRLADKNGVKVGGVTLGVGYNF